MDTGSDPRNMQVCGSVQKVAGLGQKTAEFCIEPSIRSIKPLVRHWGAPRWLRCGLLVLALQTRLGRGYLRVFHWIVIRNERRGLSPLYRSSIHPRVDLSLQLQRWMSTSSLI